MKYPKDFIFFAISIYARIEKEVFWKAAAGNCQLHCYIMSSSHCKRKYSNWRMFFYIKYPQNFILFAISIYARIEKEVFWRAAAVNCQLHCYITSSSHCKRIYSNWQKFFHIKCPKNLIFLLHEIMPEYRRVFLKSNSSELPAPLLYHVFKSLQKDIFKLANVFSYQIPQNFIFFAISIYARIEKEVFWRAAAVNCQLHCYITSSSHCKRKYSNWLNLYSAGSNSTPLPFSFSIPSLLSSIKVAKNKVSSNPQLLCLILYIERFLKSLLYNHNSDPRTSKFNSG